MDLILLIFLAVIFIVVVSHIPGRRGSSFKAILYLIAVSVIIISGLWLFSSNYQDIDALSAILLIIVTISLGMFLFASRMR
ncbi:hypothetical protein ACFL2W_00020 [Candidatus Omnitrophota bacterium]